MTRLPWDVGSEEGESRSIKWWLLLLVWVPQLIPYTVFTPQVLYLPLVQYGRWTGFLLGILIGFFVKPSRPPVSSAAMACFHAIALMVFGIIVADAFLFPESTHKMKAVSFFLAYLFLAIGLNKSIRTSNDAMRMIWQVSSFLIAIFFMGLVYNLTGNSAHVNQSYVTGIFWTNPNMISAVGVLFLPWIIWMAFTKRGYGHLAFFCRLPAVLRLLPVLLVISVIWMTQARSGRIIMLVLLFYFAMCWMRRRGLGTVSISLFAVAASGMIIAVYFFNNPVIAAIRQELTVSQVPGFSSWRTNVLWPLFVEEIFKNPLFLLTGHGWGSEEIFLVQRGLVDAYVHWMKFGTAHNGYIGLTFQIGIVGSIIVFLPLWMTVIFTMFRGYAGRELESHWFESCTGGVILSGLTVSFFETGIYNVGSLFSMPFWFAVYIIFKLRSIGESDIMFPDISESENPEAGSVPSVR